MIHPDIRARAEFLAWANTDSTASALADLVIWMRDHNYLGRYTLIEAFAVLLEEREAGKDRPE